MSTPRRDNTASEFEQLSDQERAIVGSPADYDWESSTTSAARGRPDMTQFSVRIEREVYEAIQAAAARRGMRFSDVARAALRDFATGDQPTLVANMVSVGNPPTKRYRLPDERVVTPTPPPITSSSAYRIVTTTDARHLAARRRLPTAR